MVSISGIGVVSPGSQHPAVEKLTGIEQGTYAWRGFTDSPCEVANSHELLGDLQKGATILISTVNGAKTTGNLSRDAIVLLMDLGSLPETFPVLYTRNYGKGRVVRAQWFQLLQPTLPISGYTFYIRAINWAAKRDVDSVW